MKHTLYLLLYILVSIVIIEWSRELAWDSALNLYKPQNFWLLISFVFLVKYRESIALWFSELSIPPILIFVLAALPFMLVEENINCLQAGCSLIPVTIPFLIIELLILRVVVKNFKLKSFWKILTVFCSLGVLFEITIGDSNALFRALPLFWIIIISAWTWVSYAYLTIIPLTYELNKK